MSEQRFALDSLRATLRELDRQLSEGAPTTNEERDHCVWLSTACLILADAAIEHRDSTSAPTPTPAPATDTPSVCDLLSDLDWWLPDSQLRALRRLADERYDGNLKLALAGLFEAALEELEGADQ